MLIDFIKFVMFGRIEWDGNIKGGEVDCLVV